MGQLCLKKTCQGIKLSSVQNSSWGLKLGKLTFFGDKIRTDPLAEITTAMLHSPWKMEEAVASKAVASTAFQWKYDLRANLMSDIPRPYENHANNDKLISHDTSPLPLPPSIISI